MSALQQRKVLDCRGSFCPGPITELFKAYRSAQLGDVIELWATDPAAKADIAVWAQKSGNELQGVSEEQGYVRILVKVTKKKS